MLKTIKRRTHHRQGLLGQKCSIRGTRKEKSTYNAKKGEIHEKSLPLMMKPMAISARLQTADCNHSPPLPSKSHFWGHIPEPEWARMKSLQIISLEKLTMWMQIAEKRLCKNYHQGR